MAFLLYIQEKQLLLELMDWNFTQLESFLLKFIALRPKYAEHFVSGKNYYGFYLQTIF